MKRALTMGAAAMLAAGVWLVTSAYAEKGPRGRHQGPPPCQDPVPSDMQEKLLAEFGEKGIDADKDGTLTCAEIKAFFDANPSLRPQRPHGPPPCADPVPADMQAKLLKDFGDKGIDADKDGTLTCAEIKAFFDANPSLRPRRPHGPPPCEDPVPDDMQAKLLKDFGDKGIDADKDGTLTCAEIQAYFKANPPPKPPCPAQSQGKSDNAKNASGTTKANAPSKGNAKAGGPSGRK